MKIYRQDYETNRGAVASLIAWYEMTKNLWHFCILCRIGSHDWMDPDAGGGYECYYCGCRARDRVTRTVTREIIEDGYPIFPTINKIISYYL